MKTLDEVIAEIEKKSWYGQDGEGNQDPDTHAVDLEDVEWILRANWPEQGEADDENIG